MTPDIEIGKSQGSYSSFQSPINLASYYICYLIYYFFPNTTPSAHASVMVFAHARNAMIGLLYLLYFHSTFLRIHLHRETLLILHPSPILPLLIIALLFFSVVFTNLQYTG